MTNLIYNGPGETSAMAMKDQVGPLGLVDELRHKQANLSARLAQVNLALAELDKNPGVAEVLQLVSKALRN